MKKPSETAVRAAAHALQRQIQSQMAEALQASGLTTQDVASLMSDEDREWHESEAHSFLNSTSPDGYFDVESIAKLFLATGKNVRIVVE